MAIQLGRFTLGILLLLVVVVIWVVSSELEKFIFSDENFSKPYFVTFLDASTFSIYLCGFLFRREWRSEARRWLSSVFRRRLVPDELASAVTINESPPSTESAPLLAPTTTDDVAPTLTSAPSASPASMSPGKLTFGETVGAASGFALLWFLANYVYNLSINYTSVSSNTILSSTSGLFTLLLGAVVSRAPADRFSMLKFAVVLLSIGGVAMVSVSDAEADTSRNTKYGDALAIVSSMLYACYITYLRRKTGPRDIDMGLFLGLAGLFSFVYLWPGFFIVHYSGLERFQWPPRKVWLFLLVNSFVGTVLSEILWLWATLLTSPVISTLAVSLTIPLSILADAVLKLARAHLTPLYISGTLVIIAAFFLINIVIAHPDRFRRIDNILHCRRTT